MFNCFKKILTGGSHNKQSLTSCFSFLFNLIRRSLEFFRVPRKNRDDSLGFGFAKVLAVALFLSLNIANVANADVCFLPEDEGCAEGHIEGFWPSNGYDNDSGDCDARYNSNSPRNSCGELCTRCTDRNSKYYGLYKCPANKCNCDGYDDTNRVNDCRERCLVCSIVGEGIVVPKLLNAVAKTGIERGAIH